MIRFELDRVTAVRYVRDHVLWLRFKDGLEGEVDLADGLVGGVFQPLHDPAVFAQVRLDGESIAWPNGADWAPEMLYERLLAAKGLTRQSDDDVKAWVRMQLAVVPEISRFYGIVIKMFFIDHVRPHFHAQHGEHSIAIEIDGGGVTGDFPPARLPLVFEWRELHRDELRANWERLRASQSAEPIAPLE